MAICNDLTMPSGETVPRVPKVNLGATGLQVSKLGFGTFDFGVSSLHISQREGARILGESLKLGVDYWDTSEDYGSHAHIAAALGLVPRKTVVISTKTDARDPQETGKTVKRFLRELCTDYLDIVLLHLVKSNWIRGCHSVLKRLSEIKTTGLVKAIGLSTHSVAVVREAARFDEVDLIMTICCKADLSLIHI